MAAAGGKAIEVNRAPVLTLWAAVVAECLGHDRETAITLGRAVAGSSARARRALQHRHRLSRKKRGGRHQRLPPSCASIR